MEQKALQVGSVVLALALLLRLVGSSEAVARETATALLFFSSGRLVTPEETRESVLATVSVPEETQTAVPVFGQDQLSLVQVNGAWEVDELALLQTPLSWQLRGDQPTVLILHTHATESYENTEQYVSTTPYRTLDENYNMVSVGAVLAQKLEQAGIEVIHDRTLYDQPSYNDAYSKARESIRMQLEENPSICLVLDLHRDAAEDANGNQKRETVEINGVTGARLMLVMGSDRGSLSHERWQKNLALAVKLQAQLEGAYPGLCRPIQLKESRYNQDLSMGALLVEVGTAGNTRQEALVAAEYLAQGIIALADGANR